MIRSQKAAAVLARRGQVTDRYTKAIAQLASDKVDVRIGGIYALEHVMTESESDHRTIVDVLAAFIREHARRPEGSVEPGEVEEWLRSDLGRSWVECVDDPRALWNSPDADIQAALTVLGRRPNRYESDGIDLHGIYVPGADLQGARLRGANLAKAHLESANLLGAQLQGASLEGAHLQLAHLIDAHFQNARLYQAHLQFATLDGTQMREAILNEAHLEGISGSVDFRGARLEGALLDRANLEEAEISMDQVRRARVTAQTELPWGMRFDPDSRRVVHDEG